MPNIWDISPPLQADTPVFPGDTAYQQHWSATLGPGCPVNVSAITLSPHAGAHADAPLHYDPQGSPAGALDLTPYLSPCRVIHAIGCGPLVRPEHLAGHLNALPARVLIRVYQRMPQSPFDPDLPAFSKLGNNALGGPALLVMSLNMHLPLITSCCLSVGLE